MSNTQSIYTPEEQANIKRITGGWISVEDHYPKIGGSYLTFEDGLYRVRYWNMMPAIDRGAWALVTHWMPLPLRPEE